ncbi:galactokinase [Peptoanaerobacter stomatis]|jgi:galactokinase|uniref:Galactokinase n=1 Tax=Peptoanaerobacter stomatis TaxID=796937 RepID=J5US24_9FIRM|nr:galactokinase [Peptoanaerobacter stomatis]EJU24664.1 galactokinase [Peptoanaerobacter stomatis]NWO25924.1 galactokinase [Peptostreptococcaceae bacterium oral taxon 081]
MSITQNLLQQFNELFPSNEQKIHKFFSPSRINIIGEHIDYNGGKVLPCAISIGTYGIARKNDDEKFNITSLNIKPSYSLTKNDLISYKTENTWANYVMGVVKYIEQKGYKIGGFDLLIYGNIPNGSGLSSSASLELLIGQIINTLYNDNNIPILELIKIGQQTENEFIGINSGIMDQFIIGIGKKDNAVLINTDTLEYEYHPFILKGYKIVILNTNKRRELKDSKYNERRAECDEGLSILKEFVDINNLCELQEKDFYLINRLIELSIRKRVQHVVEENKRVIKAQQALSSNDIKTLGKLLIESDNSLRELYEVTGAYLDAMTKYANSATGCVGARMTGAGFGGCCIAIVEENKIDEFIKEVSAKYKEETGLDGEFIIADVDDGVREIF